MPGEWAAATASVIVPAFQHEAFVADAVASIARQTHPHVEIVVIDDGSTDATAERARVALEASGRPFQLLRQENRGIVPTILRGFEASKGAAVSFLASDDWIAPHKVASQLELMDECGAEAAFGTLTRVHADGRHSVHKPSREFHAGAQDWDAKRFVRDLVTAHGPLIQCGLFSRDLLQRSGALRHGLTMDDWPVEILAARAARSIVTTADPVTFYRHHTGNITKKARRLFESKVETVRALTHGVTRREGMASAHAIFAGSLAREGQAAEAARHRRAAALWWPSRANLRRAFGRSDAVDTAAPVS